MSTGSGFSDLAGRLPSVGEVAIWRKASSNELQNDGRRVKYADHLEWRHPTSYFSINQECRLMPSPALPSQERDQIRGGCYSWPPLEGAETEDSALHRDERTAGYKPLKHSSKE